MNIQKLKVANGKWEQTPANTPNEWSGQCERCFQRLPAIQLQLKRLPFGRGEQWVCRSCFHPMRKES